MSEVISASTAPAPLIEPRAPITGPTAFDAFARAAALTVRLTLRGETSIAWNLLRGVSNTTTAHVALLSSATAVDENLDKLTGELEILFRRWDDLRFEDGMESDLSRSLWRLLMANSSLLIEALASVIVAEQVNPRVAAEALKHLGRFVHPPTHRERLWLLSRALQSNSPLERDGAGLGLAQLDDPAAARYLEAAVASEPLPSLKDDLQQVLEQLRQKNASAGQAR